MSDLPLPPLTPALAPPFAPAPGNPGTSALRPCVVLPTFNNAATLGDVLARLDTTGLPVIVIDDGSTDATGAILSAWRAGGERRLALAHGRNRGKGAALRTGFAEAARRGYTHAVTLDTDGQLDPAQVPGMVAQAAAAPAALVLGFRRRETPGYPRRSLVGRGLANLAIRAACGRRILDSQCGFRVYPLDATLSAGCRGDRFDYESEIITRLAWAGVPVVEAPVDCLYVMENRVTHFRPWVDSIRCVNAHCRLLLTMPWRRLVRGQRRPPSV